MYKQSLSFLAASMLLVACTAQPQSSTLPAQNTLSTQAREPLSATMGDSPNFAASSNQDLLSVVSRAYGRGAKPGALVEAYYPDLEEDHLWDAYSGLTYKGKFYWLHDLKMTSQVSIPKSDLIETRFEAPDGQAEIIIEDLVLKSNNSHVRNLSVINRGQTPISDLKLFFYENLAIGLLPQNDTCQVNPQQGTLHHFENKVHFVVGFDAPAKEWQCGGVKNFITNGLDAMNDAQDGTLKGNLKSHALLGLGVNGALATEPMTLPPGQTLSHRVFLSVGDTLQAAQAQYGQAKQLTWSQMKAENQAYWSQYLAASTKPTSASKADLDVYERALIVMKQNTARTGAILAAPTTTSPPYKFSWPRDGSFIALAYLKTGHPTEAKRFFDFMASQQKPNGGWAINYLTRGGHFYDFGDRHNEHDQVGTLPWGMVETAQITQDMNWLKAKWPVIQKACDFLIRKLDKRTGLLGPTRDLWELSAADSWTYTNAAGFAGLQAGAFTAELMGQQALAQKYQAAAENLKKGIHTYLWDPKGGYYARGYNLDSRNLDRKVEAANLALVFPFKVFPANDPRMVKMAQKIHADLSSPQGGIRRYTHDRYYDGQPWPVTSEWLGIYYALLGQKDLSQRLHGVSTQYAHSTGSLQLGEQFDENKKVWVSALPLTWSGAKYILNALAMEGKL